MNIFHAAPQITKAFAHAAELTYLPEEHRFIEAAEPVFLVDVTPPTDLRLPFRPNMIQAFLYRYADEIERENLAVRLSRDPERTSRATIRLTAVCSTLEHAKELHAALPFKTSIYDNASEKYID